MAKGQDNDATILLRLKDCKVGEVWGGEAKVDMLLEKYPGLKGFYWAKERIRGLYRQPSREEATKLLDNVIFNLKSLDDAELIRWGNTLKPRCGPILNRFDNHTANGFPLVSGIDITSHTY